MDGRWSPRIGDPSVVGWITVLCYAAAAAACLRAARREYATTTESDGARIAQFWLIFTIMLVVLGVNKQLDLQSLLTQSVRDAAKSQGWYEKRRVAQAWFIGAIAVTGIVTLTFGVLHMRSWSLDRRIAFVGMIAVFVYILLRASSFHHVDWAIDQRVLGAKVNWIVEIAGVSTIFIAALLKDMRRTV